MGTERAGRQGDRPNLPTLSVIISFALERYVVVRRDRAFVVCSITRQRRREELLAPLGVGGQEAILLRVGQPFAAETIDPGLDALALLAVPPAPLLMLVLYGEG